MGLVLNIFQLWKCALMAGGEALDSLASAPVGSAHFAITLGLTPGSALGGWTALGELLNNLSVPLFLPLEREDNESTFLSHMIGVRCKE